MLNALLSQNSRLTVIRKCILSAIDISIHYCIMLLVFSQLVYHVEMRQHCYITDMDNSISNRLITGFVE